MGDSLSEQIAKGEIEPGLEDAAEEHSAVAEGRKPRKKVTTKQATTKKATTKARKGK